jgi:subtilisin family serine protease
MPNYLAASYFPSELLARVGAMAVGSRADVGTYRTSKKVRREATRRVVFTVSDEGLKELAALVESGGRGRSDQQALEELRRLEEIALPTPAQVLRNASDHREEGRRRTWEAVLHPRATLGGEPVAMEEATLEAWFATVAAGGGHVYDGFIRRVGGLTFTPVEIDDARVADLARFNPLRVLRPMPAIRPRPHFGLRAVARLAPPATPSPIADSVTVAVFDGGVDQSHGFSPLLPVTAVDLTSEAPAPDAIDHGTGVTGAVLYGLATPGSQAPQPPLPVTSYRVLPAPAMPGDLEGYWVLDRIKEVVEANGHKIVNLSLGPTLAVEDDQEPNRWTAELDQLAWENDVLFVVAAGNDGEADRATGLHRVQVPADMANGLAVGACDAPAPQTPWARAPYSSMGPGRAGNRVQPAGVQFGGVDGRMFNVIRADGSFLEATGTSFAAPVTTHALADLSTRLPRVNAAVLRAFAVHFVEPRREHKELQDEVGHGRQPLTYADFLDSGTDEVHVLFVDKATRGELLGYQLPVPAGITGRLRVRITLAYASPVEPTQPTEYTSAALDLALRPHAWMYALRPPSGVDAKTQTLDLRDQEARDLIGHGWKPGQEPVTKTLTAASGTRVPESELRQSGKWETIRHHEFTLIGDAVLEPRLELSYVARRAGALDRTPTEVPFAILVSIEDLSHGSDLHDRTAAQFVALRAVQRVQGRLRLRSQNSAHWS